MSNTEHKLTDEELDAMEQAAETLDGTVYSAQSKTLRAAIARLRPSPQLPERVEVGLDIADRGRLRITHGDCCTRDASVTFCTILPAFPEGLDLPIRLAVEHGVTVERIQDTFRIFDFKNARYVVDEGGFPFGFPRTRAGYLDALRAAEQYAEGGK